MNYKELINIIEILSLNHNLVGSFMEGQSVYNINSNDNAYPVIYLTPRPHSIGHPVSTYNFYMYYVDRLLDDETNKIDIQTAGIKAIDDILMSLDNLSDNVEVEFPLSMNVFNEKFSDNCAGTYVEVSIQIQNINSECNSLINND